jgi:hypothetical protein
MKYIAYSTDLNEMIIVFDTSISHSDMFRCLGVPLDDVLSAGFVRNDDSGLVCYGDSHSLKKASRARSDTELLKNAMSRSAKILSF